MHMTDHLQAISKIKLKLNHMIDLQILQSLQEDFVLCSNIPQKHHNLKFVLVDMPVIVLAVKLEM